MNTSSPSRSFAVAFAMACLLTLAVFAQENQKPAPQNPPVPPAVAPVPAPAPAGEPAPAAAVVPADPSVPPPVPDVDVEKPDAGKKGLRRIDQPIKGGGKTPAPGNRRNRSRTSNSGQFPLGDHLVPKGSETRDAVSILGSTTIEGEAHSDAVSVLGNTTVGPDGKVSGAAVAVLGQLLVDGEVRDEAVSVLGGVTINGKVGGEVVSVLGDMHLGPKAVIGGDVVIVGGRLTKDPEAVVRGNEVNVPLLGKFGSVEWLTSWLKECLLKGRPLGFGPHLGWAWLVAFSFFAAYLLLALLFAGAIEKCVVTLETRPGSSILASVLTVLLSPVAMVLLAVTVVGALLVPFLAAGLFFAGLFGKAVMLAWIGRRFTKFFGDGPLGHPVFAVFIGGVVVLLLYTVWGSFLLYKLLSWLGVGVVVYTLALAMKREKPPAAAMAAPIPPVVPVAPLDVASPTVSAGFTGTASGASPSTSDTGAVAGIVSDSGVPAVAMPPPVVPPVAPAFVPRTPVVSASTLPRVGFFHRLAAMAIDGALIGMIVSFSFGLLPRFLQFHHGPSGMLLALAIYAAVMWKNKGTTIGGIVCGLKVVRLDHREIDWATAIVRAISCFLSLFVAGLGFIWVAFDDEKQSWHDKIAGTTVVRVPKGVSLL
ncbi:MAG: RDD family protein [Opitutus sp.]|nr:RDD family protein [Opitutus sp.]